MFLDEARRAVGAESVERVSDEALVVRILAGEHGLFEVVVRRNSRRLFRLAWAIVKDNDEAEDVVQNTFVNAFCHLARFEGRAKLSTWLARIAANEAKTRVRGSRPLVRLGLQRPGQSGYPFEPETAGDPERDALAGELRQRLESAIAQLPQSLRLVFVLRELEGLSTEETADSLGITANNAKVRLHRARVSLGRELSALARSPRSGVAAPVCEDTDRVARVVIGRLRARSRERSAAPRGSRTHL